MLYDFNKLQCLTKRFRTSHQISHHHKITTILCLFHENGVIIWLCYLSNASRGKESIGLATRKVSYILTHTLTRCRNPENCTKKSYQVLFVDQFCTAVKTFFSKPLLCHKMAFNRKQDIKISQNVLCIWTESAFALQVNDGTFGAIANNIKIQTLELCFTDKMEEKGILKKYLPIIFDFPVLFPQWNFPIVCSIPWLRFLQLRFHFFLLY